MRDYPNTTEIILKAYRINDDEYFAIVSKLANHTFHKFIAIDTYNMCIYIHTHYSVQVSLGYGKYHYIEFIKDIQGKVSARKWWNTSAVSIM